LQGAGGVGGLLTMFDGVGSYAYLYDGNGNVGQMVNNVGGAIAAHYEYDPYGNTILATGSQTSGNPYRFSTKYLDSEYNLYYYGFRYYDPLTGRWTSRDPIQEEGGANIYLYVTNKPINFLDLLGLDAIAVLGDENYNQTQNNLLKGVGWRVTFVLEYSGSYRELYTTEAAEIANLEGKLPQEELKKLRGNLKVKYQSKTPAEVEAVLKQIVGDKYATTEPTGSFNPAKTNEAINKGFKVCKVTGRVFMVVMLYSEYQKITKADDWEKQLGVSSSGIIGSVGGGAAVGALVGGGLGTLGANPGTITIGMITGSIVGGAIGYDLATGAYEHIYDAYWGGQN